MRSRLSRGRVQQLRRRQGGRFGVKGRLNRDEPERTPYHHGRVEVFLEDGRRETFMARGTAAADGRFQIPLSWTPAANGRHLILKVLQRRPPIEHDEPAERLWQVVARARSVRLEGPGEIDLGDVAVAGLRYRDGAIPRAHIDLSQPTEFLPAAEVEAFAARWRDRQSVLVRQPWADGDVAAVVDAVPVPGPHEHGLAGLVALGPVHGWHEGTLRLAAVEGTHPGAVVPEVELRVAEGAVVEARWRAQRRGRTVDVHATPADDHWASVATVARARLGLQLLVGELWGRVHVGLERHAVAALRNLRSSPVADLVVPHLRDACTLNALIEHAVAGDARVLRGSLPVHGGGIEQLTHQAVVSDRWDDASWPCRWAGDSRAASHRCVSDTVRGAVAAYLHRMQPSLEATWAEVMSMSTELAEHRPSPAALTDGAAQGEPLLARRRRMEEGDLERLVTWCTMVVVRASFESAWWRQRLLPHLACPETGLWLGWRGDELVPRTTARELGLRRSVVSTLLPTLQASWSDGVGEVEPGLRERVAAIDGRGVLLDLQLMAPRLCL